MKKKTSIVIIILFIIAFTFMTVGFARYNKVVNFEGTAIVKPDGKVYMKSVSLKTHTETAEADPCITEDGMVDFNLKFHTTSDESTQYEAVFEVVIANESSYDYVYTPIVYDPTVTKDGVVYYNIVEYEITGIAVGDIINKKTEKTITVKFIFTNPTTEETGTYEVDGNFIADLKEEKIESIMGAVDTSTVGDLRGNNTLAQFSMSVISTYSVDKNFTIVADSTRYIVKSSTGGTAPVHTITANDTQDFDFYLSKVDGAEFNASREKVRILIVLTGEEGTNAGLATVLVDATERDTEPPQISNVTVAVENTEGSVTLSWTGEDDSESIDTYTIITYKSNGTQVGDPLTISATATNMSRTLTGLSEDTYYFVVYGTDSSGNQATNAQISNATTSKGPACKSTNVEAKWNFTVVHNTDGHVTYTGGNTARRGTAYSTRLTTNDTANYTNPTRDTIKVFIGGTEVTNYTLSNNNTLTINPPITGNIVIEVSAVERSGGNTGPCFVEGTKILLSNGKYKNIENLHYTDLLKVYDHVNGGTTDVYPIWIETEGIANEYIELTFSDKTNLKIVQKHAIFDVDKKRYIMASKDDDNECKVGTRIYKWKNNKLKIVTITKIEEKKEIVKHYNVVSTNYYNVIANDVISTDGTTMVSNIYGFKENAIYGNKFFEMQKTKSLPYLFVKFIPHYLYKGLNLEHAKAFLEGNIDIEYTKNVIFNNTLPPIEENGKIYFMATTSLDEVNEENIRKHLYKEGSYYTLPEKGVKYFLDTFTKKKYKPGEKIKIECNIHLKAVK